MVPLVLKDLGASYDRMTGPSTVAIDLLAPGTITAVIVNTQCAMVSSGAAGHLWYRCGVETCWRGRPVVIVDGAL